MFESVRSGWSTHKKLMFLKAAAAVPAVEDSATGNPVTFLTDLAKPLKSLVANFLPIQASGTPSPDNILPITGWTGLNVSHGGKNLLNKANVINGYFSKVQGVDKIVSSTAGSIVWMPCKPNTIYSCSKMQP